MTAPIVVELLEAAQLPAGVCRFCGCTDGDACVVDDGFGPVGCSWIDRDHRVCSACIAVARAELHYLRGSVIVGELPNMGACAVAAGAAPRVRRRLVCRVAAPSGRAIDLPAAGDQDPPRRLGTWARRRNGRARPLRLDVRVGDDAAAAGAPGRLCGPPGAAAAIWQPSGRGCCRLDASGAPPEQLDGYQLIPAQRGERWACIGTRSTCGG